MQIRLDIKRRKSAADTPYLQSVSYLFDDINETVATALTKINRGGYKDTDGRAVTAVEWECSCLQCGCCLEVCPNFYAGGKFYGMAAGIPASKLLAQLDKGKRKALAKQYDKHFYSGCGKSLSCKDICPAGIETDALMVNSNALAVFKRLFK